MIELELVDGKRAFAPGETLKGKVRWRFDNVPAGSIDITVSWRTEGKGSTSTEDVAYENLVASKQGEGEFSIVLPESPYSFSGELITLLWEVKATTTEEESDPIQFVLSPTGREIKLVVDDSANVEQKFSFNASRG